MADKAYLLEASETRQTFGMSSRCRLLRWPASTRRIQVELAADNNG
jgi:hypothetical protein